MLLYSDNIRLIREYLDVIEQLQNTPKLYFNAVAEVVRRRIFSQALLIVCSSIVLLVRCNKTFFLTFKQIVKLLNST